MKFLENPWGLAENTVFAILVAATGCEAKKNAFLGYLPPVGNVWALKVGGGGDVRNTWTDPITELLMHSEIEGIFLDRARAQMFALSILQALPITRTANVQSFRLRQSGMPEVKFKEVRLANESEDRIVWTVSIGCEIVFNTIDKPNVDQNG